MFERILIANRGEIACRVIDTCRRLGVQTVAVHSDVDAGARHVAMADMAVNLGGAAPRDSYLRGEAIIAAARATGAEAIHPGYGFLSENPDFVEAVAAAGLVFIGPSAAAIRAMGLKDAAKALMAEAGVPVVPGYQGADQDPARLAAEAEAIGYPVLIKAVAGGGGKGMRRVEGPEGFAGALEAARAEARGAFGNDHVLLEKYVATPRHIELQVFGDGARAVHLFERDCSLQRRHQKVIEEAPAPGMTPEMRAAMGAAAVRAAEAIGYAGAGTVEFIVDASDGLRPDRFWFMEMNTRLQVEHPVTEAVTGVDLVAWQLRVASGEPLPARQEDLSLRGHAFEARLYAEDVPKGFLPATGRLTHLAFPADARIETGVRAGDEISPWYDPMIAKLVVHGPTRQSALRKLDRVLAGCEVAGSVTNLAFLRALARHGGFFAGEVDTGLIDREVETLSPAPVPCSRARALAALGAAGLHEGGPDGAGFTLWAPLVQAQGLRFGEAEIEARIETRGAGSFRVGIGEATHEITRRGGAWWVDGAPTPARIVVHAAGVSVFWGNNYHFTAPDPLHRAGAAGPGAGHVEAPMPGLVKAVFVAPGDTVAQGARLAILEAMKMEHTLTAGRDGVVSEVLVAEGAQVSAGAPLILLAPDETPNERTDESPEEAAE
ncbi:carbamoyl-phosphate synthase L chain ATP-binding [Dinoroseobacter shibae DFL 12 = DSM 16493]|uniref:Carbamoyl-phosphate synthase L chain ATP-binding n=1 Tax=Dinoroseobacter shibae (strain DSM 16493 / NCIMB 14021 / DFL 12) TaxID=398580 RepID=A8LIS9_DINSH|nr:biotin carboxylase N-terminal domain-containing protein [Dinoroseobacter shibae]ABV93043.1 carbamoyl-phosphate synthase L chain ATP-binding [Dinoroseobacter shibae DFL 12 = DSM 16493]URF47975.1 ATP-grasp domain-containing protein [Dinoroseobacter shibae]URF52284.1 ATP-grasp domain-containing protein [Dinoroseobacter shibae]